VEPPTVVVLAQAPRPGYCNVGLEPLLGPNGCALLQAELIRAAVAWGRTVGPGSVRVAVTPSNAVDEVHAPGASVVPAEGADPPARMTAAAERAVGPVVLVGTAMPTLGAFHADSVRSDLAAGVDAAFGPAHDGGCYLVALREPLPDLFAVPAEAARGGPGLLQALLGRAAQLRLEVGLLRGERTLDTPADAEALLLHHALPEAVAARLRARR
jgi:glycosyltransferase A (GT-A) superfamily protein (DUF2064 family)